MRFLINTQHPKILVSHLREAGCDAEHVLELNLEQSPDNEIWKYAAEAMRKRP
jgi:predicted nuclease of predicted toxin-antitoxin system